jgi:hypothetical protein
MKPSLFVLGVALFLGCSLNRNHDSVIPPAKNAPPPTLSRNQNQSSTAADSDEAKRIICTNAERWTQTPKGAEFWEPTSKQVSDAERNLRTFLANTPPKESPNLGRKLSLYNRQYVGLKVNGQRIIWGNFYCDSARKPLNCEPVRFEDGGDCFFQVEYDVEGDVSSL